MAYKIQTSMKNNEDEKLSKEFGAFVAENNITKLGKSYKIISPSEIQVTISGEEADILRFQAYSSFKFTQLID